MKNLLIIWDSMTGGSQQMAKAAFDGANDETDLMVRMVHAADIGADDILAADGYIFICPENLAAMSGVMKAMFDRCYYPCLERIEGRAYMVMVCAGSDGSNAVHQITRIATGWRLRKAAEAVIICSNAQSTEEILAAKYFNDEIMQPCRDLGRSMAAGLNIGIF